MMLDLHTHSLFSDGELIPSELVRRFEAAGYSVVAITDHVDSSTLDFVVPRIVRAAQDLTGAITVIPGVELTHVPPTQIGSLCRKARELGARLVVVHGETIVEPVPGGPTGRRSKPAWISSHTPASSPPRMPAWPPLEGFSSKSPAEKGTASPTGMWRRSPGKPAPNWCSIPTPTLRGTSWAKRLPARWRKAQGSAPPDSTS